MDSLAKTSQAVKMAPKELVGEAVAVGQVLQRSIRQCRQWWRTREECLVFAKCFDVAGRMISFKICLRTMPDLKQACGLVESGNCAMEMMISPIPVAAHPHSLVRGLDESGGLPLDNGLEMKAGGEEVSSE